MHYVVVLTVRASCVVAVQCYAKSHVKCIVPVDGDEIYGRWGKVHTAQVITIIGHLIRLSFIVIRLMFDIVPCWHIAASIYLYINKRCSQYFAQSYYAYVCASYARK